MGKKLSYIVVSRSIDDSDIFDKPPHFREVWWYLIRKAEPFDCQRKGVKLKRGQLIRHMREIQRDLSWHVGSVVRKYKIGDIHNVFRYLRKNVMVTTRATKRGVVISVLNYDEYQDLGSYGNRSGNKTGDDSLSLYKERIKNNYGEIDVPKNFPLDKLVDFEIARMKGKKDGRTKWDDKARKSAVKQLLSLKDYAEELKRRGLFSIGDVLDLAIEGKWRGFTQYKKGLKGDRVKRQEWEARKEKNESSGPRIQDVSELRKQMEKELGDES